MIDPLNIATMPTADKVQWRQCRVGRDGPVRRRHDPGYA
jgi:hypothetical protein